MREGYKQTEVGVIPADWIVTHLGDIGQFKNGINKGSEAFGHGSPFVNLLDVFGKNHLQVSDLFGLVDSSDTERNTYNLKKGDVIFIRSSVKPSGVGLTAVAVEDLPQTVYSGFLIRFRDNGKIETNYKKYCFYEEGFRKRVISASSVSANTNINQDNLKSLNFPLPPTKTEQTAIANALSDADAWIQSLTRLIAKKRQIKQGAMQTLLTPYENGCLKAGWAVKKLGEIASFENGKAHEQFIDDMGSFIVVNSKFISTQGAVSKKSNQCISPLSMGDIVMVMSDIPNGKALAKCFTIPKDDLYTLNQRICSVRSSFVDNDFLALILNRNKYYLSFDSGTGQTNLKKSDILDCPLQLPLAKTEQTHIATILSDMDNEITALESKLTKAQQIKQGMMQNLLTGRIRLL